jgi:GYF domain 2
MADEWIIRVEGKEYGPADLNTLREWKAEGRLIPVNEVRRVDGTSWEKASLIPELFDSAEPPPLPPSDQPPLPASRPQFVTSVSTHGILPETFLIYTRGFFKYLGLTLLALGPSICAQMISLYAASSPSTQPSARTLVAGSVVVCLLSLGLVMKPIYIAGIQILTAAFAAGERISFFATLNEAVKYWPRVALLWIFVFLCYGLLTLVQLLVLGTIMLGSISILSIFVVLSTIAVTVWLTGRLFVNFMFWQQFAVLEGCTAPEALRRSRELARGQRDQPWFRRPMWRGVFIASLWFAVVLALNWPFVSQVFALAATNPDSHKLMPAIEELARTAKPSFAADILQAVLQPLLGIAFVLLFLNSNSAGRSE